MVGKNAVMKAALLDRVGGLVQPIGFRRRSGRQSFEKKTSWGKLILHLSFGKYTGSEAFPVAVNVAIRFNLVEGLIQEASWWLSKSEAKETATIGTELGNYSRGEWMNWDVGIDDDVPVVAQAVYDAFVSIGLPYLEKFSDMETTFEALVREERYLQELPDARAKACLALACLLGKRERFEELVQAKTEMLRDWKYPKGVETIEEFAARLRERMAAKRAWLANSQRPHGVRTTASPRAGGPW